MQIAVFIIFFFHHRFAMGNNLLIRTPVCLGLMFPMGLG